MRAFLSLLKILKKIVGTKEPSQTILEVFKQHDEQMAQLVGKVFSPLTLKRYKIELEYPRSYINWKYKISDIEITKLTMDLSAIQGFLIKMPKA